MRSRSPWFGLRVASWLSVLILSGVVACGGSPEVNGEGDDPTLKAGSGNTGRGGSGSSLNVGQGDGGTAEEGGKEDIPDAGPGCGDGEVNQDEEECDDGNKTSHQDGPTGKRSFHL